MNAPKHGFFSEIVQVPEDREAVVARNQALLQSLKPQNIYHAWVLEEISLLTIKLERCGRVERQARDQAVLRAETSWDGGLNSEVEAIALKLVEHPAWVVDQLKRTPHGCDWLMDRWAMLAGVADRDAVGKWNEGQRRHAFDLLGTQVEFRDGESGEVIGGEGRVIEAGDNPAEFARRQIDELTARREGLADGDALARKLAEADMVEAPSPEVRRQRLYEAELHCRFRWSLAQMNFESPRLLSNSDLVLNYFRPEPKAEDRAETSPEPLPAPAAEAKPDRPKTLRQIAFSNSLPKVPFDLEPHECPPIDVLLDFQAILEARQENKLQKAEARRLARRKKLKRLLG
jgi:hypothetical protein